MTKPPQMTTNQEYLRWLGRVELRAIMPMKWFMWGICVLYWMWVRDWEAPDNLVFGLFFVYAATTAAIQILFLLDRVSTSQLRLVVYVSYMMDLLFVTGLIWLDLKHPPPSFVGVVPGSDYYILYLLLILRGFALFRTRTENAVMAGAISALFLISLLWQGQDMEVLRSKATALRLALIWATMLLAWMIVNIVNEQKEELVRAHERLVRSEGLAALGELAAGVAHEINNPIGIIKAYAEFLERSTDKDDPNRDDFETIRKEAERCETIVRRMMDFANPGVTGMEVFDPGALLTEAVEFVFHKKKGSGPGGEVTIEGDVPKIYGDPGQIKQALLNILINARQIVESQGSEGQVTARLRKLPGPRSPVEITIHDNGPGISVEDAEKAFEPFFTKRDGGTGLGLAITRRIIEAHGGTIAIWPAADGGTSCAISLPISEEDG